MCQPARHTVMQPGIDSSQFLSPAMLPSLRYWHSTAAYAIATAVSGGVGNLPASRSEVYRWPKDLLPPSLVLLLTIDPEERQRRLRGRGLEQTREEAELEANHLFRQK